MTTDDGALAIIFNGEVVNYVELRKELTALGHVFHSTGDTEVLLRGFQEWDLGVLPRLVGMFAFAVLDSRAGRLVLARDCFGIKPLYWRSWREGLAFASEPGLLTDEHPRANVDSVFQYLRFGRADHGSATMFAGVHQLPPAHFAVVDLADPTEVRPRRYWSPRPSDEPRPVSANAAAAQLRELFVDSVRLHLRSDVPLGTALSGGIDSTAIVCTVRHIAGPDADISGFSWVPDDDAISEETWIQTARTATGVRLHLIRAGPHDLVTHLDELIRVQGEPFVSTSIFAQRLVFERAAGAGVRVMLDGQGADELFGGYRSFASARLATLIRAGRPGAAARLLTASARQPGAEARARVVGRTVARLGPPWAVDRLARFAGEEAAPPWLNSEWFDGRTRLRRPAPSRRTRWKLLDMLQESMEETSLPALLRYEDRNSMAVSVESRVPFLTPALAQFALALPEELILGPDGTTKVVLRQALRGLVPDAILDRRDKIGFATPEPSWLRSLEPWVEKVLGSDAAATVAPLRPDAVQHEWARMLSSTGAPDPRIWRWLNLIRWTEVFGIVYD